MTARKQHEIIERITFALSLVNQCLFTNDEKDAFKSQLKALHTSCESHTLSFNTATATISKNDVKVSKSRMPESESSKAERIAFLKTETQAFIQELELATSEPPADYDDVWDIKKNRICSELERAQLEDLANKVIQAYDQFKYKLVEMSEENRWGILLTPFSNTETYKPTLLEAIRVADDDNFEDYVGDGLDEHRKQIANESVVLFKKSTITAAYHFRSSVDGNTLLAPEEKSTLLKLLGTLKFLREHAFLDSKDHAIYTYISNKYKHVVTG